MNFVGNRLVALKEGLTVTWGELAELLGISRSMLDFLRNGVRNASPSLQRKIEQLENDAGLKRGNDPARINLSRKINSEGDLLAREERAAYRVAADFKARLDRVEKIAEDLLSEIRKLKEDEP